MFKNLSLKTLNIKTGLRESLRLAALGNFEGMDIDIEKTAALSREHSMPYIRGMFDSFNIKPGAWALPFSLDCPSSDFTASLGKLEHGLSLAKEIGATRILANFPENPALTEERDSSLLDRLLTLCKTLHKYGCRIGLAIPEKQLSVNTGKNNYSPLVNKALSLCREVKTANAGILLDARAWIASGRKPEELKEMENRDIVYARIPTAEEPSKEATPEDQGSLNLFCVLQSLEKIGYDGPLSPGAENKKLTMLPPDMAVILAGGYLSGLLKKAFT